jgi:hypothetical protein
VNQATLPFDRLDLVRTPRARHDDPTTSQDAARRARIIQRPHGRAILEVLSCAAGVPLNAYEIAARSGRHTDDNEELSQVQVARRMGELVAVAIVVVDGVTSEGRRYRLAEGATW